MAAFTSINPSQLENFLILFDIGELASFEPIANGIDNSNFFVHLDKDGVVSTYVLTIFETLGFAEVPFFLHLTNHLHQCGLPVAATERTLDGMTYTIFRGKPTVLVNRLPGAHLQAVTTDTARQIGQVLADIHACSDSFSHNRSNPYNGDWLNQLLANQPAAHSENMATAAEEYLAFLAVSETLPRGLIHGDLFVDNALFENGQLTGVLDFYRASDDCFLLDIAIAINDWAFSSGEFRSNIAESILDGYQQKRQLTTEEKRAWPLVCKAAALRFWLTRIESGEGSTEYKKDPAEFQHKFLWHQQTEPL